MRPLLRGRTPRRRVLRLQTRARFETGRASRRKCSCAGAFDSNELRGGLRMTRFAIYARVYPEFYREVENHSIPTDLEAAKALSSSPAALDLFAWLSYRCFMAKGRERVPLFGDFVLVS